MFAVLDQTACWRAVPATRVRGSVQDGPSAATKGHTWSLGPRLGPSTLRARPDWIENQRHAAEMALLLRKVRQQQTERPEDHTSDSSHQCASRMKYYAETK